MTTVARLDRALHIYNQQILLFAARAVAVAVLSPWPKPENSFAGTESRPISTKSRSDGGIINIRFRGLAKA